MFESLETNKMTKEREQEVTREAHRFMVARAIAQVHDLGYSKPASVTVEAINIMIERGDIRWNDKDRENNLCGSGSYV